MQLKMKIYTDAVLDRLGPQPIPSIILDGQELALWPVEAINAACRKLNARRDNTIDPISNTCDAQWGNGLFVEHMRILSRKQP